MNDSVVMIIVGALGVLGGGGFWGYWQSRKDQPVKKRDADLAAAEKSQQMALAVADDLREDLTRLRTDLNAERDARNTLAGRFDQLEVTVREQNRTITVLREVARTWDAAWQQLTKDWATLRLRDTAPERPLLPFD